MKWISTRGRERGLIKNGNRWTPGGGKKMPEFCGRFYGWPLIKILTIFF